MKQIVKDSDDLIRLIEQGNTVRRVAATKMNDQSSRSHSCFTIKVQQKLTTELSGGVTREQMVSAKLNLVDLAGSERAAKTGASGQTLKEGAKINLSLMTLGTVINALAAGGSKGHINYRDSQLTRLLQVCEYCPCMAIVFTVLLRVIAIYMYVHCFGWCSYYDHTLCFHPSLYACIMVLIHRDRNLWVVMQQQS